MTTPSSPAPTSGSRPPFRTTSPLPSTTGTLSQVPPRRWAAILGDLQQRGAPTDDVQLVSARLVTWNNGSLGCPKPGQVYTQALVDGMQVVVSVLGQHYDYRFGANDTPKLCEPIK